MRKETKVKINIIKELMKLPVNKRSNTVKVKDIKKVITKITKTISNKEAKEFMNK